MVPRERLSVDAVVDAALDLVERDGVDALTMRRLAGELGVDPATLYRVASGKDELLDAIADRLLATPLAADSSTNRRPYGFVGGVCRLLPWMPLLRALVDACSPPAPWKGRLESAAGRLRSRLLARPELAPIALRRLDRGSFDGGGAPATAARAVFLYTVGFVLLEVRGDVDDGEFETGLGALLRGLG